MSAETPESRIEQLVGELRSDFPHKATDIDRYVRGARFQGLEPEKRLEALYILRGALEDARRKSAH